MKQNIKLLFTALFAFLFLCLFRTGHAHAFTVPNYDGPVNDNANIISSATENALETQLATEAQKELGVEIAVLTVDTLDGEPIEDAAQMVFDAWKIGKQRADNGVLLLIALRDRETRIHTGYGAEIFLPDAAAGDIMRSKINPQLANGNYDQAIQDGVNAILERSRRVDQNEIADGNNSVRINRVIDIAFKSPQLFIFFGVLMSYLTAFLGRSKRWWPGGVIGGLIGFILGGINVMFILGIIGFILDYILSKNYRTWNMQNRPTNWGNTWGGFYNNKPPFRFGGGRSGGGGVSGKW